MSAPVVPTRQAAEMIMTVCNSGGLHLRADPGTSAEVLAILSDGEIVTRTNAKPKYPSIIAWYQVIADGVTGWVSSKYLCEVTK